LVSEVRRRLASRGWPQIATLENAALRDPQDLVRLLVTNLEIEARFILTVDLAVSIGSSARSVKDYFWNTSRRAATDRGWIL
jgi:hypothetical protein